MSKEFSIKKEIEIEVKENLNNLNVDVERVYEDAINDEFLLDAITLSIYVSISEQLKEKNTSNEEVDYEIAQLKRDVVQNLMNRGII